MLTLLHVEDNTDDANLFAIALQYACAEVFLRRVLHGGEAIDYLEGNGVYADRSQFPLPDLVVMDWLMPVMNGAEFLRWRDGSRFSTLPVAVFTGMAEPMEIELARNHKSVQFFEKPIGFDELQRTVERICRLAIQEHI